MHTRICPTYFILHSGLNHLWLSFVFSGEMKSTLPSVSAELKAEGISHDEDTIDRIIDYFDMSADGEIDKGGLISRLTKAIH